MPLRWKEGLWDPQQLTPRGLKLPQKKKKMEEKGFTEIGSTFEDKKETPEEQGAKAEDDRIYSLPAPHS